MTSSNSKTFTAVMNNNIRSQVYESYKDGYVHPEFKPYADRPLKTTPTGLSFRLMHPDDPAMAGFIKDPSTGMLYLPPSDGKATMFSPPAEGQYWNPFPLKKQQTFSNSFDARSINPFTGKYSTGYTSKTAVSTKKYASIGTEKKTMFY
jgi:hypothetical protein